MAAKKKAATELLSYTTLQSALLRMSESELRAAIKGEVLSDNPRVDMLSRMISRLNKRRSDRVRKGVLGLLSYKGKRRIDAIVDEILDGHG